MINSRWAFPLILFNLLWLSRTLAANDDFDTWKKKIDDGFHSFLNEDQRAFKKALESEWQSFLLSHPEHLYNQPKLDEPPIAKDIPEKKKGQRHETDLNTTTTEPVAPPPLKVPEPRILRPDQISIEFLGKIYQLPKITLEYLPLNVEVLDISAAWESLYPDLNSIAEFISNDPMLKELPDWGLISVLDTYSFRLSDGDENGQKLFFWALMMELGFDCRVAHNRSDLFVLLPSYQKIYGKSSLNIDGNNYYILLGESPNSSLYTHSTTLNKNKRFDFSFRTQLSTRGLSATKRTLVDTHSDISVTFQSFPQLASYYRSHPALDFVWYFKAQPNDSHYAALIADLKLELKDLPELTQVNKLLGLVQHGFEYLRDDEQWGEEYYATPMHTLMLDAVDCEDRSFLFSYLVEQVIGLQTVGLKYPGHLAVAVELIEPHPDPDADSVYVDGRKFYVSDPTYIGANVGQAMTIFDGVVPSIINKSSP